MQSFLLKGQQILSVNTIQDSECLFCSSLFYVMVKEEVYDFGF